MFKSNHNANILRSIRHYSQKSVKYAETFDYFPKQTTRFIKKGNRPSSSQKVKIENVGNENKGIEETNPNFRKNEIDIQMLSKRIYDQLFGHESHITKPSREVVQKCRQTLKQHSIKLEESSILPEVDIELPKLEGANILEHFYNIGERFSKPYRDLIENLVNAVLPPAPKVFVFTPGWHQYIDGQDPIPVPYPPDDALVFDVEVCVNVGSNPVMACAVSSTSWYGWVSDVLVNEKVSSPETSLERLIPLESLPTCRGYNLPEELLKPKLIVGHNVSYDRARVKEQYWIERTGARFLDTMSIHVCVSGITSYQRSILKSKTKEIDLDDEKWIQISSLNSLAEVHKLYCGEEISKEPRNIFLEGTLDDVRNNFQELMKYCCSDVKATASVLKNIYPMFKQRFPHPVTLAGMLELGSAYLPLNSNWENYVYSSDLAYSDIELEAKFMLIKKAEMACKLMHNEKYKEDMWMWDQDWSTQHIKVKKIKPPTKKKMSEEEDSTSKGAEYENSVCKNSEDISEDDIMDLKIKSSIKDIDLVDKFKYLYKNKEMLPKVRPLLPGYPLWYRKLCVKPESDESWSPGPANISTGMQVTPKLLQLTWEGYPLHYIRDCGWGFLVPFKHEKSEDDTEDLSVPLETLTKHCPVVSYDSIIANESQSISALGNLTKDLESEIGKKQYYSKAKKYKSDEVYKGTGIWSGVVLSDCCYFMRLPHKDGASKKVGNPLAKDFLNKFSENVLSGSGEEAKKVLSAARMMSYWRNNRDRIKEQKVMWLNTKDLPLKVRSQNKQFGVILPQVIVCGTLTRRAVEPTWMTASNAHIERIGSELRCMIQSPPGYSFVGADVDSQELWIASILGDSLFGIHGATPFGWMTLSGSKSTGTDMHSHTAAAANITRDHAKVINYARIYGAGQNFAERLLKQFNPSISDGEAKNKAFKMFITTKGKRSYRLREEFLDRVFFDAGMENSTMSKSQATTVARINGKTVDEMFEKPKWSDGTESDMFNRLEEIAASDEPKTPFLGCSLTRALLSDEEVRKRNLPTIINWVVQSGAVDFLHMMLVNMAWLTKSKARFCLSFHDEVRYLVPDEYKYNVALALHITNLYTRAFCAKKLGFNDLPQSVAFFTSVDVDTVLRKESNLDCVTPSNPHGLFKGYGIPSGESLDIWKTLEKCGGSLGKLADDKGKHSKKMKKDQ